MWINSNLTANKVVYQGYYEIKELGIGSSTSLNALVEGGKIPAGKTIMLWGNSNSAFGRDIQAGIEAAFPGTNFFGWVIFQRTPENTTVYIYARPYNSCDIYTNVYSAINSFGWAEKWGKISSI